MSGRCVLILANPFSGHRGNERHVAALTEALRAKGLEPEVIWDREERAQRLAEPTLSERCRCIVAAGGDGSILATLNELMDRHVPLATVPLGNENLFAREFGFRRDAAATAAAIERAAVREIDLGTLNGQLFTLMMSAGFDADVVDRLARWRSSRAGGLRRVSRLSYAGPLIRTLRDYRYPLITVEANGVEVGRGSYVAVFNLPRYGGFLGLGAHASGDDGLLDWMVFERPGTLRAFGYGMSVLARQHLRQRSVQHGRAARIVLRSDPPAPVQADGDPAGHTPAEVSVIPQGLRVIDTRSEGDR